LIFVDLERQEKPISKAPVAFPAFENLASLAQNPDLHSFAGFRTAKAALQFVETLYAAGTSKMAHCCPTKKT
jgi:hypothetical protein